MRGVNPSPARDLLRSVRTRPSSPARERNEQLPRRPRSGRSSGCRIDAHRMARARPDLGRWLDRHDGIAAVTDALDAGFTRYAIRLAVERGLAVRVRRRWLARPTAPADLVFAARAGGTIACVSAARRHGVWTVDDGRTHLVVPAHAGHVRADGAVVRGSRRWRHGSRRSGSAASTSASSPSSPPAAKRSGECATRRRNCPIRGSRRFPSPD